MQRKLGRAPSGRLTRLKPVEQDPLAEYGLPSKGEKRLLAHKVQESYYALIVSRYLALCTEAGDRDSLQKQFARLAIAAPLAPAPAPAPTTTTPSTSSTSSSTSQPKPNPHHQKQQQQQHHQHQQTKDPHLKNEALPPILAALRKLREALVASHRHDHFATQVYLFSVRVGILASAYETYYPALARLLFQQGRAGGQESGLGSGLGKIQGKGKGGLRDGGGVAKAAGGLGSSRWAAAADEAAGAGTVDEKGVGTGKGVGKSTTGGSGSRDADLTSVELHEVVGYLVLDAACRRGDLAEAYALRNRHALADAKVDLVLKALVGDNWVVWRRVKKQMDGYRVKLMEFAEARVRGHTLKAFGRAYHSVPVGVLEEQTGCEWAELTGRFGVGWELEAGKVVIRRVQGR